jgi:hypothetical protein
VPFLLRMTPPNVTMATIRTTISNGFISLSLSGAVAGP